jgi:lipooligosaccharide transport system permease protein
MIGSLSTAVSRRFFRVWQRNLTVYRKNWKISFIPPFLEPLFYLLAFGIGLGGLVGAIRYGGFEWPYVRFIAPGIIAISIMQNAFFETTYNSYVRMYYQKTFDAIIATPLSIEEVIVGEIVWGATKSVIAAAIMLAVITSFGFIHYPEGLLILPLSFLGGLAFGSIGMLFTGTVATIELFNLPVFLFVTPMFLFSGTFFPIETLPAWARWLASALPLTHLASLTRSFSFGLIHPSNLWAVAYLLAFTMVFFPLAVIRMHKRLIK